MRPVSSKPSYKWLLSHMSLQVDVGSAIRSAESSTEGNRGKSKPLEMQVPGAVYSRMPMETPLLKPEVC